MRLTDAYPLLALNAPGAAAVIRLDVTAGRPGAARATAELLDRGVKVGAWSADARVETGTNAIDVTVQAPTADARGYQVQVTLERDGSVVASGSTALLCAHHWRSVPRYGFLSEFVLQDGRPPSADAVRELAKFHITIVQFYDWMYRHYRFLPPKDASGDWPESFTDAMGREVAPGVVMQRVKECKAHGMAPIAYGAVYGPEPEFILERPDWLLYDSAGKPLSLIDLFYITDLRPGPWREHIMAEFEASISEAGFGGIHMDQYGMPKLAYDSTGALVDPAGDFASMIDEAAGRVRAIEPEAGVIFNAVNDWPIDLVAPADQEAVYIEVWSPHDTYRDLFDLIRRSRDLSGKHTILSAYLLPFHLGGEPAEWSLRYITAVINAAGGHHLILGEGSAVLREPYYPDHGHLSTDGVASIRRYYDHSAALTHYLHAPDLQRVSRTFTTGINDAFRLHGAPATSVPEAGSVWVSVSQRAGQFIINLVNLTAVEDGSWNVPQPAAGELTGLRMVSEPFLRVGRATWMSPDAGEPGTLLTPAILDDGTLELELPALHLWATIVIEHE